MGTLFKGLKFQPRMMYNMTNGKAERNEHLSDLYGIEVTYAIPTTTLSHMYLRPESASNPSPPALMCYQDTQVTVWIWQVNPCGSFKQGKTNSVP